MTEIFVVTLTRGGVERAPIDQCCSFVIQEVSSVAKKITKKSYSRKGWIVGVSDCGPRDTIWNKCSRTFRQRDASEKRSIAFEQKCSRDIRTLPQTETRFVKLEHDREVLEQGYREHSLRVYSRGLSIEITNRDPSVLLSE